LQQHDERENQVHRAYVFVVGRKQPAPPARRMVMVMIMGMIAVMSVSGGVTR
jgi:hypothetical protein